MPIRHRDENDPYLIDADAPNPFADDVAEIEQIGTTAGEVLKEVAITADSANQQASELAGTVGEQEARIKALEESRPVTFWRSWSGGAPAVPAGSKSGDTVVNVSTGEIWSI